MTDLFMHLGVSYSVSQEGDKLVFDPVQTLNNKGIRAPRSTQTDLRNAYARMLKRREAALIAHTYRVLRPSYGRQA